MKRIFLASLITLASWAGIVRAQPTLGTPIAPCESCKKPIVFAPIHGDWHNKLCQSGVGQLAKEMLAPIRLATGNLLPPVCVETISREEVERMIADGHHSPAQITAAKIKLDESQANARRAAVRYLAGVNCHYYPEAESALIAALRADRSECVRLEAALAIGTCNCMTAKIAEALRVSAAGCETDGNPAELSQRVRTASRQALGRHHSRGIGLAPNMLPPSDWSPPSPLPDALPGAPQITVQPMAGFGAATAQELSRAESISSSAAPAAGVPTGQRTLYHLILGAMGPREVGSTPASVAQPPRRTPALRPLGLTPLGSEVNLAIPNP